jgi:hypothetical protein
VSPEKILLPAYTTLIFPVIVLFNIGFILFWALAKKWHFLISLAALIYAAPEIALAIPMHFGKSESVLAEKHNSVMT